MSEIVSSPFVTFKDLSPEEIDPSLGVKTKQEFLEKIQEYTRRGFQEWPKREGLTRFQFSPEAKFLVVPKEGITEETVRENIRQEAFAVTHEPWQVETLVEQFDPQGQKRVIAFVRKLYAPEALGELADTLDDLQKTKNEGRGVTFIQYIIDSLRHGDYSGAKADCFNQSDKFGAISDIQEVLAKGLFTPEERTPWKNRTQR